MVRIIAHRGASATHRENTIEAFKGAEDEGAFGVELDVRRAADDVLVVHHDAHLEDGRRIRELSSAELPEWVPTLGEALDACPSLWVNVEIKNLPDDPDYDADHALSLAVAGLLDGHLGSGDESRHPGSDELLWKRRVLVSSFNLDSVLRLREINSSIPIGWIVWGQVDPAALVARAAAHALDSIHPHDVLVDRSFVTKAHDAGLAVNVWTVDDPERLVQLTNLGVDGLITNTPGPARLALASAGVI